MTKARDIASAAPAPAGVTSEELGFVDGVTSALQTQIDSKIGSAAAINPTIVDAKGDIIAATAADTVARLAVGANNTVLTADSAEATGMKWAAAAGGGKVLQVVNATHGTTANSSSATFADTGLTATITPTSATSKILVFVSQAGCGKSAANANAVLALKLLRASTDLIRFEDIGAYTGTTLENYIGSCSTSYLDSPATTSATTYKTQFQNQAGAAGTVSVQKSYISSPSTSTITLMEIGA
jgi:hypothetical protein